MAKGDKEVKIRIETEADTKGAEKETKALENVTEAVEELTEAEKERAKRKAEYEQRMATPGYSDPVNPMTDGSQLAARQQVTEATRQQAEAVEDLTFKVEELSQAEQDALKAQRDGDLERVKAARRAKEDAESAAQTEKILGNQRAQIALQFSQDIARTAAVVRSFAVDLEAAGVKGSKLVSGLATGMEAVSSATSGAAAGFAAGGPLGAAIGGAVGLFTGPLKSAITGTINELKLLKLSQDNVKESADRMKTAQERASLEGRRNSLLEWFRQGKQAIDEATAALERHKRVLDATAQADATVRQSQQTAAVRAGVSPVEAEVSAIEGDTSAQIEALRREVEDAKNRADLASVAAAEAENQLALIRSNDATTRADVTKAETEAQQARQAAENAQQEAATAVDIAEQRLREILAEKDTRVAEAFDKVSAEAVTGASNLVSFVESSGQELSASQQRAKEEVEKILADGKVTAEEQQRLRTELNNMLSGLRDEQGRMTRLFLETTDGLVRDTALVSETAQALLGRVQELENQLRQMRLQSLNAPSPR